MAMERYNEESLIYFGWKTLPNTSFTGTEFLERKKKNP